MRVALATMAAATMCGGVALTAAPLTAQAAPARATAAKPKDATLSTALSGSIPCSIGADFDLGCGRMRKGKLTLNKNTSPNAHIEIKDIDYGGHKSSVRLIDVAGTKHKEAVVLISANAGGVSWPNFVIVYDGNGKRLATWNAADAISAGRKGGAWGARETATFSRTRANSVDIRVDGIATGNQCEACGTHTDVYRLTKGKNGKPAFRLISRR